MLAEGAMLRIVARYKIVAGDFAAFDRATDLLLDSLYGVSDISDPDVAVSMTEPSLEVWFTVPTENVMRALAVATGVLESALAAAGLRAVGFSVAASKDDAPILGAAELHAEALPA